MLFDSHCHLHALASDWRPVRVQGGLAVGVDVSDWQLTAQMIEMLSGDWHQAIGFHPWVVRKELPWQALESQLVADESLAIGEIGLDGSVKHQHSFELQVEVFKRQLLLAKSLQRIVSLHVVQDNEECYHWVRKVGACRGIVHGFKGSLEQGLVWQGLGFYLGISWRLLAQASVKQVAMLKKLDANLILLETDAPFTLYAGHAMTPDDTFVVAQRLALYLEVDVNSLLAQCRRNWQILWGSNVDG